MADEVETTETTDATTEAAADQVTEATATETEGQKDAPKDGAETAAPEAFAVTAPEGMEAFAGDFEKFSADMDGWLKANPNATAREALAEAAQRQARVVGEQGQAYAQQRQQQIDAWGAELKADKEFGGEKFDANLATAIKGVEAVGSPALRQLLDETGMGSHPEIVRAFLKVGQLVADAPFATGAQPPQQAKDLGARMYPNMKTGKD